MIASRRDLQAERRQSSGLSCRRPHPHRAANPGPARRTPALGVPDHSGAEGRSLSRSIYARQPASRARRPQRGLGTALTVQALAVRIDLGIAATFRGFSSIGQSAVLFCVGSSSDNPPSAAAALGVARAGHRRRGGQPRGGEAEANISASVAASSAREHRAQRVPRPVLSSDPPVERIVYPTPCASAKCGGHGCATLRLASPPCCRMWSLKPAPLDDAVSRSLECEPRQW